MTGHLLIEHSYKSYEKYFNVINFDSFKLRPIPRYKSLIFLASLISWEVAKRNTSEKGGNDRNIHEDKGFSLLYLRAWILGHQKAFWLASHIFGQNDVDSLSVIAFNFTFLVIMENFFAG